MPKLVVKKHRPLELVLYCSVLSGLIALVVWFWLDTNHWGVIRGQLLSSKKTKTLWEENRKLQDDNLVLQDKVLMLERLTRLDHKTTVELQQEIRNLQDKLYQLSGELEFYEGIMSSSINTKGLNIQGLYVDRTEDPNFFRYKLILTNVGKSDNLIKVSFDMLIEGMHGPDSQTLNLDDIALATTQTNEIMFNNFERIEGSFAFPVGFKPIRIVVNLRQKFSNSPVIKRIFEWADLTG